MLLMNAYAMQSGITGITTALEQNDDEGYHSKFKKRFGTHPNLWRFLAQLKEEERAQHIRQLRIDAGNLKEKRP